MTLVGAVDVGSNAMRCAVGRFNEKDLLEIVETDRKTVSLGRSVFDRRDRAISDEVIEGAREALSHFMRIFKKLGVSSYRAVGTSALRDASNQRDFIEMASSEGVDLSVISGQEEARLIRIAVEHVTDLKHKRAALLDIGGGSAEFTVLINGEVKFSTSEKVGTIRLLKMLAEQKISTERFSDRVRKVIESLSQKIESAVVGETLEVLLGTGGNIEELGNLRARIIPGKKKTDKIRFKELGAVIDALEPLTPEERQTQFGFRADRSDVILPASIVLREVMRSTGLDKVVIPRVGLREGILIELLSQGKQ